MKRIGVLGGLGPQATMDFVHRVHRVSQRLIPQQANSGYPPMVVHYCRHAPFLLDETGQPLEPLQPDPRLFEAARQVGAVADFLVITANGPHILQEQIEQAAGCEILSMIEVTLSEVRRRQWRRIGVLGLGEPLVYLQPLEKMGISYETLAVPLRSELDAAILALMAGQADEEATQTAWEAISFLQAKGVDGTILGCTEVPLMLGERADEPDLISPAQLLAEAAVRYALT